MGEAAVELEALAVYINLSQDLADQLDEPLMDMESMAVEDSQKEGNIFDTINNFTRRPITDILDTVFAYQTVKVGDDTTSLTFSPGSR